MNKAVILLLILVIVNFCSASCDEGQIDINSASLSELQEITGIGPVYAQGIIDNRYFISLEDLTKVNGIAEKRLEDIKSQELACVSSEYDNKSSENSGEDSGISENKNNENSEGLKDKEIEELKNEIEKLEKELDECENTGKETKEFETKNTGTNNTKTIKLSPKNIKSEENNSKIDKSNYAFYGLIAFSVIMLLLIYIRRNKIREELV